MSCAPTNPINRGTSTMVPSAIACFARMQDFLRESICHKVLRAAQVCVPTGPSRMEWEDLWEVGLIL